MATPMPPTLPNQFADIWAKLGQAHEHVEAFNHAAKTFWKSDVYAGTAKKDRQGRALYVVTHIAPRPPEMGIHIGEAVHQLRSSLDHLMWLLAKPKAREESKVQFPIVSSRPAFYGRHGTKTVKGFGGVSHMMPNVQRGVRTVVESVQPYHRRRWPETRALAQLQVLSNWDKHRTLTTTGAGVQTTEALVRVTDGAIVGNIESFTPVLEVGAILARFEVLKYVEGANVYMKPITTIIPQFDKRTPKEVRGRPVVEVLRGCNRFISGSILPLFARFF